MTKFFLQRFLCRVGILAARSWPCSSGFFRFPVLLWGASFAFWFCSVRIGIERFTLGFFINFCTSYVKFLMLLSFRCILFVYLVVCFWCPGAGFVIGLLYFFALIVANTLNS